MKIHARCLSVAVGMLFLVLSMGCSYTPRPTKQGLIGTWVGYDESGGTFSRLELTSNGTGYFARAEPYHDVDVSVYEITAWDLDEFQITFDLTPVTPHAEPIYLKGKVFVSFPMDLEVGGKSLNWSREVTLSPEHGLLIQHQKTKEAIENVK